MKRTVLLLIVSLFIVGTLAARVTVPDNVMYEVPEPEPESITDVTEEAEHTSDVVGPAEEKAAETVSPAETDDTSEDEGEIDLPPVPSDVEENPETKDEPVGTETTETSEHPETEVTEASVDTESAATEEVSQTEDATMENSVETEMSKGETDADVADQDLIPVEENELTVEENEPTETGDEIVTIDEPSEVTEAESEVSEQPSAEMEKVSVETDPETTEEVAQPEDVAMEDSVGIEVSEDEPSADVVVQDVVPDEGNELTEMADEIVTIDEPSDTVTEEEPVEGSRMKLLIGMEATHFAWSIEDGAFVAGHPLPCSGVFVAGLLDDRYMFGADARILLSVDGTSTNANLEVLGRFGMLFPVKRFSNNESVLFAESDLFLGTAFRNDAGNTSVYPVVGFAGRIHLGRDFLTMAFGTDVTIMFPVSDADKVPSYTIRPNVSMMWNL